MEALFASCTVKCCLSTFCISRHSAPPFVLLEHCSSGSLLELLLGRRQVQRQVDARYDARCQDDDAMGYASLDGVEAIPATSPNQVIPVSVMLGLAAQLAHGMEALANAQVNLIIDSDGEPRVDL